MKYIISLFLIALFSHKPLQGQTNADETQPSAYSDLIALFQQWRVFEKPPLYEGAPDYRAETFEKRRSDFEHCKKLFIDRSFIPGRSTQQVDWTIVWAEMNGYDFNDRILKPWVRDPAFYKSIWTERSDVPAHEGPTHHAITELWTYQFSIESDRKKPAAPGS